jgi:hypothetical protein
LFDAYDVRAMRSATLVKVNGSDRSSLSSLRSSMAGDAGSDSCISAACCCCCCWWWWCTDADDEAADDGAADANTDDVASEATIKNLMLLILL